MDGADRLLEDLARIGEAVASTDDPLSSFGAVLERVARRLRLRGAALAVPESTTSWGDAEPARRATELALETVRSSAPEARDGELAVPVPGGEPAALAAVGASTRGPGARVFLGNVARLLGLALARRREALAREARERRLEELLAVMSHDLRTPLGVILLSASLLRRGAATVSVPGEGKVRRPASASVDAIERAARRIDHLIEDLVDLTRLEIGRETLSPRGEDLEALLAEALRAEAPIAALRGVRFEARVPAGLPRVRADRVRMARALRALLAHCAQLSPEGTAVAIEAVESIPPGSGPVSLVVASAGAGLSPDELERVLARSGTSPLGAGLELAIAAGYVRAHGFGFRVERSGGSAFRVDFPLAREVSETGGVRPGAEAA